ncbi:MAG: hypothetical protein ABL870_10225, partial [Sediminibacterium sp.]
YIIPYSTNINTTTNSWKGAIRAMGPTIRRYFGNFYGTLKNDNYCSEVYLDKAWIRLNTPDGIKIGGGYRVKSIVMNDNWAAMGYPNTGAADTNYGQEYEYTEHDANTNQTRSSGVASYEPGIGGEENPFKQPIPYNTYSGLFKSRIQHHYQVGPVGDAFYPSPSVGYAKVTVKNIGHNSVSRTGTGKQVSEFYTTYDFPTIVDQTDILKKEIKTRTGILQAITGFSRHKVAVSQGYAVQTNDMNGRPKAEYSFAEEADQPYTYVKYHYKTIGGNQLDNAVKVMDKFGNIKDATLGVEIDFVTDQQESSATSINGGVAFNSGTASATIVWAKPSIEISREKVQFNSAVTTKVISRSGLIDYVEAFQEGSLIKTYNKVYDEITGDVLLTETQNEHNDPVYNFTYPA